MSSAATTMSTVAPTTVAPTSPTTVAPTTAPGTTSPPSPSPSPTPSPSPSPTTQPPSTPTTTSPTSTNPATTAAPTTPTSSAASPTTPTSNSPSTVVQTTTNAQGTTVLTTSVYSDATTPSPTTTSWTSVMTQVPTTITSTNSVGSTVFLTTDVSTYTSVPVSPSNNTTTTTSNLGAIIGGVVGGVAVLGLLGLVIFCFCRRRRRDEFDGDFDPDRVLSHPTGGGTLPQVDLGDDAEVRPMPPFPTHGSMRQYGDPAFLSAGVSPGAAAGPPAGAGPGHADIGRATSAASAPSQYSDTTASFYPQSAVSPSSEGYPSQPFVRPGPGQYQQGPQNMYAVQQADWHNPRPMMSPAPSVSNTSSSGRAMKEREAAGRQSLGLATQQEVDGESSGLVQHTDVGRAPSEHGHEQGEPSDVPPAYESIRP